MRWNCLSFPLQKPLLVGIIAMVLASGVAWAYPSPSKTPTPTPHRKPSPTAVAPTGLTTPTPTPALTPVPAVLGTKPIKLLDVDNHSFVVNRRGRVCIIFETDENSQELARKAGEALYPFEGRHDFQMTVVVDLSNSIASWVHDLAVAEMRKNLDSEALKLTPYYAKNKNPNNPRKYMHVVADFDESVGSLMTWKPSDGHLRAILFSGNGKELLRWNTLQESDFPTVVSAIKKAMDDLLDARSQELPTSTNPHAPVNED